MKNLILYSAIFSFVFLLSCKKEKTKWNSDWSVPLVHGNLTIGDLVQDENIAENSENYTSLIFNDTVYSFDIDTLIKLPDTSLVQKAATTFPNLTMAPGNLISSIGIDQLYNLNQIQLKRVKVKEGTAIITISSPWPGKSKVEFSFPKTTDGDGNIFSKEYILPAGTTANPSVVSEEIDMANFDFDLTGTDGTLINNITADAFISSAEETASFVVLNTDTVLISIEFKDMKASYAKGYFGQYEISDVTSVSIKQMKSVMAESLLLDSINLDLSVKNGFKLFTQATFSQIRGHNSNTNNLVDLTFPNLNSSININPASGGLYDYVASSYNIAINSGNSNVLSFIENLPDSIQIGFKININPDGNVTGGDDEYFPNSSLDLLLDGELPLKFSANNFSLMDTFKLNFEQQKNAIVAEGKITIDYVNRFPIGVTTSLILLDENLQELEILTPTTSIIPGSYDITTAQSVATNGTSTYILNQSSVQNLELTKYVIYKVSLTTDQTNTVKINIDDYFNFNLYSDLNLKFSF